MTSNGLASHCLEEKVWVSSLAAILPIMINLFKQPKETLA